MNKITDEAAEVEVLKPKIVERRTSGKIPPKPLDIRTPSTLDRRPWSLLLYGLPKSGKTVLAASAPRCLLLELDENGAISLRNHKDLQSVGVIEIKDFAHLVKVIQQLNTERPDNFDSIAIDTVTTLQENQRLDLIDKNKALKENSWDFNRNLFAINNFKISLLIKEILELRDRYNLILTAHLKEELIGPENKKQVLSRPYLSPALLQLVNATVDGIFNLAATENGRVLQTKGSRLLVSESRFNIPDKYIKDPNLTKISEKYLEMK